MRRLGVAGMAAMFILAQAASAAAEEPRKIELDLASQPLYNALQTFAEMLDYQLLVRDKDISTRIAPPLRGVYTVDEALSILLKGSGLKYEVDASGLIVVGQNSEPRQRLIAAQESETIGGAMAQSASQPGGGQSLSRLEEIVVTAQKRAQSINDVGITINAFTGDMLRDRGIRSADEMALVTPGLTINESFTNGVPVYTIRGVGFSDYSAGASSTVGLYFDEVSIPYAVMSRGILFDMERVEVLKGPQGDLYGRNTTAGQINFISRKPTKEFEAGITAEYARFDVVDFEGYVSGPLSDSVRARIAAKATQSLGDGWQRSVTRPDDRLGEQDVLAARGLFDIDLGDNGSLLLNAHWVRDKSDNMAATAYNGLDVGFDQAQERPTIGTPSFSLGDNRAADWSPGQFRPRRDNELKGVAAKLNWDFNGVVLTSITGYDKFERSEANDSDGSAILDSNNINVTDLEVFSQELRLSSDDNADFTWIVGAYYSWDKISEDYNYFMHDSFYSMALGIRELDTRYDQKTESIAGFAHAEWQFAEKFRLVGGVRYTEEDRDWSGCTYDRDGTLAAGLNNIIRPAFILSQGLPDPGLAQPGGCGVYDDRPDSPTYGTYAVFSDSIATNKWMWKIGLNYEPTDDVLLFATVSKGFKSGGFNGANANTHTQLVPYGPEELLSVEVGTKASLQDGRLQLNLSGFWYDYKDKQEQDLAVTFVGNISGLTNVPKSRIIGVEAEMRWLATEGLTLDLGVAWLDTEVKEWMAVDSSSVFPDIVYIDASGMELANSPQWQLNATATYDWVISNDLMVTFGADVVYKDSTTGGPRITSATDDYWLANARVSLGAIDGNWRVTLWGRNLFDEYYYPSAFIGGNGPYVRILGMPRTYGITFDYKF